MTDKNELNFEEMENVNGGAEFPKEAAGGFKIFIGTLMSSTENGVTTEYFPTSGKKGDANDVNSGGGNSGSYNNTNDGGKQMNNQGEGNKNDNSGTMNW